MSKRIRRTFSKELKLSILRELDAGATIAQLARARDSSRDVINDVIEERDLDQAGAAEVLGIDQADVSRLINGKLSRFSLDRLMTFVDRLGEEIDIHQKRDRNGHLVVTVRHMARA